MSLAGAKAAIAAELANVTWVVPATAAAIPVLGTRTAFLAGSIFTYEGEQEFRAADFPVARILVPGLDEQRTTSGSDLAAQKLQTLAPQVYVLFSVEKQFSQGGHALMDAILDGIMSYFRQHSGGGGTPSLGNNDLVTSVGHRQRATVDRVVVDENDMLLALNFRGMVSPTIQMSIV